MNERLTLELETKALGQESVERLTAALDRFTRASEGAGRSGSSGISSGLAGVGNAAQAAEKKVQSFVGAIPGMGVAAERFINLIPGLGAVITQAFPLLGLIAFTEGIGRLGPMVSELAGKFDPLTIAQNRATEAAKEYNSEITRISEKLDKIRHQGFDSAFGKSAGSALQLGELQGKRFQAERNVSGAQADLDKARGDLAPQYDFLTGEQTNPEGSREFRRAKTEVDTATKALTAFQQKLNEIDADMSGLAGSSAQSQKSVGGVFEDRAYATNKRFRDAAMGGLLGDGDIVAGLRAEQAKKLEPQRWRDDNGDLHTDSFSASQENVIEAITQFKIIRELEKREKAEKALPVFKGVNENSPLLKSGEEFGKEQLAEVDRSGRMLLDALKQYSSEIKQADEANILGIRSTSEHQSRLIGLTVQPGNEVAALRAERDLRKQAIAEELQIKQSHPGSWQNMQVEEAKGRREMQDAQFKFEESIQELRNKNLASFRDNVVKSFDDIVSGKGGNVLKSFGLGIERQIIGNIATEIYPKIQNAMKGTHLASSGLAGRLLAGTPFGPDPLKVANDLNTAATTLNTTATTALAARLTAVMTAGGTGGSGSFEGIQSVMAAIGLNGKRVGGSFVGSLSQYGALGEDGLPTRGMSVAGMSANAPGGSSTMGIIGKYGGAAVMAGTAAIAAAHGFSRGGLGGAMEGTAGVAAVAGAVLPLLSKSLALAGPIGAIVGAGLGLAMGLLPDRKKQRADEIGKELNESIYHAPTALSATMDGSGNFTDFDARGTLRRSNFSGIPQVRNPYTRWQDGQPYEAPGSETSPYTVTNNYHINAVDATSFQDFARRNSTAIADAVADHLGTSEGRLSGAVRYAAGVTG